MIAQAPLMHRAMAWRGKEPAAVARVLAGTGSAPSPEDIAFYARLFGNARHVEAALGMMANWDLAALAGDLPRLAVPLVLVVGTNDRAISPLDAEKIAARVARTRIFRLAAGHLAHEECPEAVANIIFGAATSAAKSDQGPKTI
jgi:magnesium chelatase accessory protein